MFFFILSFSVSGLEYSLLSEYLGTETMLAIVCKTYNGVKSLEKYDKEGSINKTSGLHGFSTSLGKTLEGRFNVISLETLRYSFLIWCGCLEIPDFSTKIFFY